jgi:hypothetical protein
MWIINPEIGMVETLAQYGRFLESDYRMAIEHLEVPRVFEEYAEKTNRKFVIIGANDAPWMLAKTVFLCLKLAGPDSIVVKSHNIDEIFMVQNIFEHHAKDVKNKTYIAGLNDLELNDEWLEDLEQATDIIVFGDENIMKAYREYETVDRHVWEHGSKFSFGIVKEEHLTPTNINDICFDFFSFYGEGSLAPKFYFVLGKIRRKHVMQFSDNMNALYGVITQEYRDKLPLTKRSDLVHNAIAANYVEKYVRLDSLKLINVFDTLYGDVRLIQVDDLDDIESFIKKWQDSIVTVAVNTDDDAALCDLLDDMMVVRVCHFGDMQFPGFFEQYDHVDDFNIFVDEETE